MSRLPGILGKIEAVAGTKAALELASLRGGTEMKFSGKPGGALAQIVGDEAAVKITELLGTEKYYVPQATARGARGRREAAARMVASGASTREAALAADISQRTIERLLGRPKSEPKEPRLPGFED